MAQKISEEDREDILQSLAIIAQERRHTIVDAKAEREHLEDAIRQMRVNIWEKHYNANRVLVQAIDQAAKEGMPKAEIYECIGMTSVTVQKMRKALIAWEKKKQRQRGKRSDELGST